MGLSYQRICLGYVTVCWMFICISGQCTSNMDCMNGGSCQGQTCACSSDWTGTTCELRAGGCLSSPCIYGVCDTSSSSNGYRCNCYPGHTGLNCDIIVEVDPCLSSPCLHGVCSPSQDSINCVCDPGYGGTLCNEASLKGYCANTPCLNGGACVPVGTGYRCNCKPAHMGENCEFLANYSSCSQDPCDAGECIDEGNGNVYCDCTPFTGGAYCERTPSCDNRNPCRHGGECIDGANNDLPSSCNCNAQWTGEICEFPLTCNMNTCRNGGTCMDAVSPGQLATCLCTNDWDGPTCEDPVLTCTDVGCYNGGTCDSGTCLCPVDYSGEFCEDYICGSDVCYNGGTCEFGTTLYCYCPDGFSGDFCEIDLNMCGSYVCYHGATCVQSGNTTYCVCPEDFTGQFCETDLNVCGSDICYNGGSCVSDGSTFYCACLEDFTGDFCESDICGSDVCYNGGTCEFGTTLYCYCPDGFSGDFCEIDLNMCGSYVCYHGATCVESGNTMYCVCPEDFTGQFCETDLNVCGSDICYNGGSCVSDGSTFYCACLEDFTGDFCESVLSPCISEPCQNGGTCVDISSGSTTVDPGPTPSSEVYYVCECPSGYSGRDCEMGTPCTPNPCMNNGVCSVQNGQPRCNCASGFQGQYCDDNPPPASNGLTQQTIGIIAGSAAAAVIVIVIVIAIACCCCRKKRSDDKDRLTGLELGVNQRRRRSHDYIPSPTKTMMPAIPNLKMSKMRDETKMEFPRNRLTFLNKLGSGSFADVYKAEAYGITEKDAKTIVAVKKLKDTATENDKSDLSKEISLFMYLDPHPNIVNILGCCTDSDPWYIIMEYLPYGNLQGYLRQIRTGASLAPEYKNIKKQTDIPPNDLLSFGVQIARGMEYLASRACIHRDLAARNILLGEGWVCKVSDFGLARDLEDGQTYEMKSQGRVPVRWMSPESLLHNTYTSQSDVWSFAILIWEIVTLGSHPYPGLSSKQVVKEISAGYRLPKPEHCSQDIYNLMKECWAYDPDERPTFTQVKLKLENMLADAQGYLVMSDFNDDNYLYLEPDQQTGDTLDEGFSHLE